MKLGIGLYRHMLTRDNFLFARQAGATHVVVHLVDYFGHARPGDRCDQPTGAEQGWGPAGDPNQLWSREELTALRREINEAGLEVEAIENFDPAHWHDILLDGPKKNEQIENIKAMVRCVGAAGIPIIGYNFSIAGVCGRIKGPFARGGAVAVGMQHAVNTPMPRGMVWNMIYDAQAPPGDERAATSDELWQRLQLFLDEVLPVAEEAGVKLAAHPDDPPLATLRSQPRLIYKPELFQRLLDLRPSSSNMLEFCIGTIAEMEHGDVYEATDRYSRQQKLAYVHFRNVRGKAPQYHETFVDEGDVDMVRIVKILKANGFEGVLIPDHTPQLACDAPWHAGMAYALGYTRGVLQAIGAN